MLRSSIPLFFVAALAGSGCAGTLESSLEDAHEARRAPPDLRVVYDDHTPLAGGDRIEVTGETLRWWKIRPGFVEATSSAPETLLGPTPITATPSDAPTIEHAISREALLALVDLLLSIEPWEQAAKPDGSRLDQRRATLRVDVANGGESTWEWRDALEGAETRLGRVRTWAAAVSGDPSGAPLAVEAPSDTTRTASHEDEPEPRAP